MTIVNLDAGVRLKKKIRAHFKRLGFERTPDGSLSLDDTSKDAYRAFHEPQRLMKLKKNSAFIRANANKLINFYANGDDVEPHLIRPELELVGAESWQSDLFRFASLQWQIPVSDGYGRRMRFLVWDRSNDKLIGLIALGDAVFNLSCRDNLIGWNHRERSDRLCNLMDAYVLGAVPPYNLILGGKLVASLVRTQEVKRHFESRYSDSVGVISGVRKKPKLVMVTTTSALGRSSVYNRLKLDGIDYLRSIGYTSGWGHFHISDDLFLEIRRYLASLGDAYADGHHFGSGPNWRLRAIRKAFRLLGLSPELMRHRLVREVFVCDMATNSRSYLRGDSKKALFGKKLLDVDHVAALALDRWVIPRAERRAEYREWRREQLLASFSGPRAKSNLSNGSRA
jgi:hypothetical protein